MGASGRGKPFPTKKHLSMSVDKDPETALRESEERFHSLFNNAFDCILLLEPKEEGAVIIDANEAACSMHGYSKEELIGMPLTLLDCPEDGKLIPERVERLMKGERLTFEIKHVKKDGTVFPVEVTAQIVTIGGKRFIQAIDKDITERQRTEEAIRLHEAEQRIYTTKLEEYALGLQRSQAKYMDLFENANDMIFTIDPSGLITSINRAAYIGFGYDDPEKVKGVNLFDLISEDSGKIADEFIREAIRQKSDLVEWQPLEFDAFKKTGRKFNIEIRMRLLKEDEGIFGFQVIARDVTFRKEMETTLVEMVKEIRDEKNFSESVIRSLSSGLIVLDTDDRVVDINPSGRRIFGDFIQPNEIESKKLHDLIGFNASHMMTKVDAAMPGEVALKSLKGMEKNIGYTTVRRTDATGAEQGLIVLFSDITEAKTIEKEMERINRLSTVAEVASAVAHEVRNPLAGIKTMAQSIEENLPDDDPNKEYVVRITRQVDRLNNILREFFDYARPLKPKTIETSLIDIIREIIPLVKVKIEKKKINVVEKFEEALPHLLVDPNQMQQVFLNLFLNSIDALGSGGEIEISAKRADSSERKTYGTLFPPLINNEHYITVYFRDNGPGISKEVADKIFEPFFTTKANGTGLGLSIVYRILRENNSAIFVDSPAGTGTVFTIFAPSG